MHHNHVTKRGFVVPTTTPFGRDGSIDVHALVDQCLFLREYGAAGIFLFGTTGEFLYLDSEERMSAAEAVIQRLGDSCPVIVHTGANTTRVAIALGRAATDSGATAIAAVTPFYYAMDSDEVSQFYADIAAACPAVSFLPYNIADNARNALEPDAFATLAAHHPSIRGAKLTTASLTWFQHFVDSGPGLDMYIGNDALILPALTVGAWGSVSSNAIVFPEIFARLFSAVEKNDLVAAQGWQRRARRLTEMLQQHRSLSRIKCALRLRGLAGGAVRAPMQEIGGAEEKRLVQNLRLFADEAQIDMRA
ncbi:MAG: dihydrodipicolinate synthase family protein [Spirochaetales bacterium]|nr:dihydrodipicolinate synthase family protein [Spirochaetales bacterium]